MTTGATEALYCAIFGHINPGDEVIIIEPFYNVYEPMVRAAGGVPRFIPLRLSLESVDVSYLLSSEWVLDEIELQSLFHKKTKMIIVNTPNNPIGKVKNRV